MAILIEYYKTRSDGVVLNRTYSDNGFLIERDGVRYSEAIDPAEFGRVYTETEEMIEGYTGEDAAILDSDEATAEDYQNALSEFGVKV